MGLWRDRDQGMSMGEMMQSRESTLTNSNQRVNMGTCDELASTRTYFLQRHSHNCTAGAVWAGRMLSLSHRTRPYSREPDRLNSTSQKCNGSVVVSKSEQAHDGRSPS